MLLTSAGIRDPAPEMFPESDMMPATMGSSRNNPIVVLTRVRLLIAPMQLECAALTPGQFGKIVVAATTNRTSGVTDMLCRFRKSLAISARKPDVTRN
jgi:hypothetical protein